MNAREIALQAAYGKRSRVRHSMRRARERITRAIMTLGTHSEQRATRLRLEPTITKATRLADLDARFRWYLPNRSADLVAKITVDEGVSQAAEYLDPLCVRDETSIDIGRTDRPSRQDHVVIHDARPSVLLRNWRSLRRATIVDPTFYFDSDVRGYLELLKRFGGSHDLAPSNRVKDFLERSSSGRRALVLGTGPSASDVRGTYEDWDERVICNSAVANVELRRRLRPTVITFGDPVFHLGPSRYAAAFRQDLQRALEESDAIVVVPNYIASVFLQHYEQFRDRLFAVPLVAPQWNFPSSQDPSVCLTGNVLTQQMLPIAFRIAHHVDIAGCDGRQSGEKYYWKHGASVQYSDELMETAFITHPAFFRDRNYADYYDRHCAALESLLQFAEASGRAPRSVTRSYIPALVNRAR